MRLLGAAGFQSVTGPVHPDAAGTRGGAESFAYAVSGQGLSAVEETVTGNRRQTGPTGILSSAKWSTASVS